MPKLIDRLPAALANRVQTRFGTQFVRFAMVAVLSLGASEIALFAFIGPLHLTGGVSGVCAGAVGAIVSYFLSRRAWGRTGRPDVLRETIPFWLVSVGAWLVLGLATKVGLYVAHSLDLHHFRRHLVVGGIYFLANCLTFMVRFLIFHYVLFADGGGTRGTRGRGTRGRGIRGVGTRSGGLHKPRPTEDLIQAESLSPVTVSASSASSADPDDPRP